MKEHVKAVRHGALAAIEAGGNLVDALGAAEGKGTNKLRRATKRFVRHLKEELADWEDAYKKARLEG